MSESDIAAGLAPEDEARAALYGLIARLFYAPPDADVIAHLLQASAFQGSEELLARSWRDLVGAARTASLPALENEHTELFVGTGKSEVTPYLTHYTIKHAAENPLVELRQQLNLWCVARRESVHEPEDHIAGVCEAMRYAIAVQHRSLDEQSTFFERFLYPGAIPLCDAVTASRNALFYRQVAQFAHAFFELERQAFEML